MEQLRKPEVMKRMAKNLLRLRNQAGMSQTQFAYMLGISQGALSKLEAARLPTVSMLTVIGMIQRVGYSLDELLK